MISSLRAMVWPLSLSLALTAAWTPAAGQASAQRSRSPGAPISEQYKKASKLTGGLNFFDDAAEIELGESFALEVDQQLPILDDAPAGPYIQRLGDKLVRHSLRPDLDYTFRVVDSAEINAFAGPGGFIYIHRGLIEAADDESQLASVVAHEISHVVGRHSVRDLSKQMLIGGLLELGGALVGDHHPAVQSIIENGGGFAAFFAMMKYSRAYETQADLLGVHTLYESGYDPRGAIGFFEKLLELEGTGNSRLERLFASHPPTRDRIRVVTDELPYLPRRSGWSENRSSFRQVQRYLRSLPPSPEVDEWEDGPEPERPLPRTRDRYQFYVEGTDDWIDTGLEVEEGERIAIRAGGTISWKDGDPRAETGPDGTPRRGWLKPISDAPTGALIARVGEGGQAILVGADGSFRAETDGRLYLGINDDNLDDNSGYFEVTVRFR